MGLINAGWDEVQKIFTKLKSPRSIQNSRIALGNKFLTVSYYSSLPIFTQLQLHTIEIQIRLCVV